MSATAARAVVFGYHDVGVRGLSVLLSEGIDVVLVVTHEDDPDENRWFGSIAELADRHGIPVIKPSDPNVPDVIEDVRRVRPDWYFSFYYRKLLGADLLALPAKGAYNLHGSLLPRYRGRAPVNWAVLHGETETGASLHRIELKPDAGPLVDQEAVPILPNDTAHDVFQKVTCAAEKVLVRAVPALMSGSATETPLDLDAGSYFGRRRPQDGRIDWNQPAWTVHNLIRAVAPPYPGAFFDREQERLRVLGSYYRGEAATGRGVRIYWEKDRCFADCSDGKRLHLTAITCGETVLNRQSFQSRFGTPELEIE